MLTPTTARQIGAVLLAVVASIPAIRPDRIPEETLPPEPECAAGKLVGGLGCGGERKSETSGKRVERRPSTTVYPFRELWQAVLRDRPDAGRCLDTEPVRLGRDPFTSEELQAETQFLRLVRAYGICPDAELTGATPAMEAVSFFESVSLPTPQPEVKPGRLPVGFESFLETGAPTVQTFATDTPFGPLTLTATAEIYVDWDDPHDEVGGFEGPMTGEPGPYPDGDIWHVYQYDGWYDISVRYDWTANWSIGAVSGVIEGVETTGSYDYPGFEAYSRQAVG